MLTNNYYKMKGFFDFHTNSLTEFDNASITVTALDGSNYSNLCYSSNSNSSYGAGANSNYSMKLYLIPLIGAGTVDPTVSDYCLTQDITSSITGLSMTMSSIGENGRVSTIITLTGVNGFSSGITITEIGIAKKVSRIYDNRSGAYDPATDASAPKILLDHTLLETPITVAPGDNFSITLEWVEQ